MLSPVGHAAFPGRFGDKMIIGMTEPIPSNRQISRDLWQTTVAMELQIRV